MSINTNQPADRTAPARNARAVTPADGANLSDGIARALYVGTGGDLKVILGRDSDAVTLANVPDGTLLPIEVRRVYATGTTADDIVALY